MGAHGEAPMKVWIGTSGWQYGHWRERFYPRGLPQAEWLETYAGAFQTVESNNAFYRLPEAKTFAAWAARTPPGFVMAVKVSRYLTHIKRLSDPEEPVERFVSRVRHLGDKLGPVLLQLPPTLRIDLGRLEATLERFPSEFRVAVEFRHDSWYVDDTRRLLERRGAALCLADRRGVLTPLWRTADWTYLRFHEGRAAPRPCYGRDALRAWVARLHETAGGEGEAFVYFNNDLLACALRDAVVFGRLAQRAGMQVSALPELDAFRVG
jgi:uncharacterized protein YecE (DUF72 family)